MDAANPYEASETPIVKPLGSLAQSARGNTLNQARGILLFIGIVTILVNGFLFATVPKQVDDAINAEIRKAGFGATVDPQARESLIALNYLVAGGAVALGVVFTVFGLIVKQFPVPITILSLVLYIGAAAGFALLDPMTLAQGIIIKIFIVIGLIKAVQAARAYQKEADAADAGEFAR